LSVACSLNHIRKQSQEVQDLLKPMYDGIQVVANIRGFSMEGLMTAVGACTIREIMEMIQTDDETILAIDKELHNITNNVFV